MTPSSTHNLQLLSGLSHSQVVSNHSHLFFCVSKDIGSKHLSFISLIPEQRRSTFTSIQRLERCHLETLLVTVVVRELSIWQTLVPTSTILQCTSSQHIFQNLVDPFSLSISLWVVSRTEIQLCPQRSMYFLPELRCKLSASIRHNFLGNIM